MSANGIRDITAQIVVTEKSLNAMAQQKRLDAVRQLLAGSFAERLVVDGTRAMSTITELDRDPSTHSWEINVSAETMDDPTLIALLGATEHRQRAMMGALMRVNSLPWWRWLWLKLRGREIVAFDTS